MHVAFKQGHIPYIPYKTTVIILTRIYCMESCIYQFDPVCVLFSVLPSFVDMCINRKNGLAKYIQFG